MKEEEASSRLKPLKGSESPHSKGPHSEVHTAEQIKACHSSSQAENRCKMQLRGIPRRLGVLSETPFCLFEKRLKYLIGLHLIDLGFLSE